MKWPCELIVVRHGESEYNELYLERENDPLYQEFCRAYEQDPASERTRLLAERANRRFPFERSDLHLPLTNLGKCQAQETARALREIIRPPEVIYISPYARAIQTFEAMQEAWPEMAKLADHEPYIDDRLRERDHGIAGLRSSFKLFFALNQEQMVLHDSYGEYYYRFPQGENIPDIRARIAHWIATLIREFSKRRVLVISHRTTLLALHAQLERMNSEAFIKLSDSTKQINCGVSTYIGRSEEGRDGRLITHSYNQQLYPEDL